MPARILIGVAITLATVSMAPAQAAPAPQDVIGASVQGRNLNATRYGAADASTVVVVIGQMHGDERAGRRVVEVLRHVPLDPDTTLWLVPTMNPDGDRHRRRTNARGVDLNRNFPATWKHSSTSGAAAASEPETLAIMRWLADVQPDAVLVLHQPFDVVDVTHQRARPAGRALARWMGVPARIVDCDGPCHGTLTEWVDRTLGAIALTIELDQRPTQRDVDRTATAIGRLSTWLTTRMSAQS